MTTLALTDLDADGAKHTVRITAAAYRAYMESIAVNSPETFALIGGSLDDPMLITDFHFMAPARDKHGRFVASSAFVYPDHEQVNYIIDNVLVRKGHYILGLWHSHPGEMNAPSGPDLDFCSRIIANDDSAGLRWNHFLAPITTFDSSGKDTVTAWVLPKGGTVFEAANFAVEQLAAPAEARTVRRRSVRQSDPMEILTLAREFMLELEQSQNAVKIVQAYQIAQNLKRAQSILGSALLLNSRESDVLIGRRRAARIG